jgi:hypothetical protein
MKNKGYWKSCMWDRRGQNKPRQVVSGSCPYKGVTIRATIRNHGKAIFLGVFSTAEEAAKAYDQAALLLHGDEAVTNESLGLLK